jgi:hypothetical protein
VVGPLFSTRPCPLDADPATYEVTYSINLRLGGTGTLKWVGLIADEKSGKANDVNFAWWLEYTRSFSDNSASFLAWLGCSWSWR